LVVLSGRVLVIGATGFIGSYVARHLTSVGYEVLPSRSYKLDLLDRASIGAALDQAQPDHVINLGAISTLDSDSVRAMYDTNAFAVLTVLEELAARQFAGRFINASGSYVYGRAAAETFSEDTCPKPIHHYGWAKLLSEHFCSTYPMQTSAARQFNCMGVGQDRYYLVPKLVDHFARRVPVVQLGNLDIARDYIDVRDVARFYGCLLAADEMPPVINLCTGQASSIRMMLDELRDLTGHEIEVSVDPSLVRMSDVLYMVGDNRLSAQIGFTPKYSLRETLQWMLENAG